MSEGSSTAIRRRHASSVAVGTVLMLAASALIVWRVLVAIDVGPGWDSYAFLSNAAQYAGLGFGYTEPHRAPLLPFITSLVFRITGLNVEAIQWVDGAFTLLLVFVAWRLLRRRLPELLAASMSLALLGVTPLWSYLGVGYTDTGALALSLLTLLFLIKATEEAPAWLLLCGPLFVAAVLMRFTTLLIAFPCLLWIAFRGSPFRHARAFAAAVVLALASYMPAALMYRDLFDDALFPFIVAFGFNEAVSVPGGEGATSSTLFYLSKAPGFIAPGALAVLTILVLFVAGATLVTTLGTWAEVNRPGARKMVSATLGALPAIVTQMTGMGLALRQATLLLGVYWVWRTLSPRDADGRVGVAPLMDAVMVSWVLTYLDLHGHQGVLVPRYFIPMVIPVLYLIARGWDTAANRLSSVLEIQVGPVASSRIGRTMSLLLVAFVAVSLVTTVRTTAQEPDPFVAGARDTARELTETRSVDDAVIYSDVWPLTAWYLRTNVRAMPSFRSTPAYAHELAKSDADYFVTIRSRRFDEFEQVTESHGVVVLERARETTSTLPRVLYLGKSWDNYLEEATGFTFFLDSTAGRYGWEGTSFLDAPDQRQLKRADAVAVFGVKWRDRAAGEAALEQYVRDGGSVIIDASRNLDGLAFSLADTVILDSVVRRRIMPRSAKIVVDRDFARTHDLPKIDASPFIDETGDIWAGADYDPAPDAEPVEVLATAGGRPIVSVRRMGRGRVYFIGYNLVWHAFSKENDEERALVDAVFADAIAHSNTSRTNTEESE